MSRQGVEGRDDVPADGLEVLRHVHVFELEDDVIGAGVRQVAEPVDDLLG
jgi:hypothetical protein